MVFSTCNRNLECGNFRSILLLCNDFCQKITWQGHRSLYAFCSSLSMGIFAFLNPVMLRLLAIWAVLSIVVPNVSAQWRAPKYSNEFLSIGTGAAGMALSGAQTAAVEDVTSAYWNPAGLTSLSKKNEIGLMHASYFAGIANFDYAAYATRIDSQSTLAVSFIRLAVDDIPDTRYLIDNGQLDWRRISSFSSSDNALFFSYAHKDLLFKGLSAGGSFKVIYRNAGKFANAWGFGLDAGLQYKVNTWAFGLMVRDVATTFNAWTYNTTELEQVFSQTGNAIPVSSVEITLPTWTFGVSRQIPVWKEKIGVRPIADFAMTFDGERNTLIHSSLVSIDPRFGLELSGYNLLALRGGIAGFQQVKNFENGKDWRYQINFGVGLKWKAIAIDYAMTDLGNQAEALYSHIFSLKASF